MKSNVNEKVGIICIKISLHMNIIEEIRICPSRLCLKHVRQINPFCISFTSMVSVETTAAVAFAHIHIYWLSSMNRLFHKHQIWIDFQSDCIQECELRKRNCFTPLACAQSSKHFVIVLSILNTLHASVRATDSSNKIVWLTKITHKLARLICIWEDNHTLQQWAIVIHSFSQTFQLPLAWHTHTHIKE